MNNVQKQRDEGFTIIEVVLVLAIAALIMLMVFIALPALQRNQRDNARKNDISRLQSAVNNYKSGNRGVAPTFNSSFIDRYLTRNNDQFADPSGDEYTFEVRTTAGEASGEVLEFTQGNANKIYINPGGSCRDGQNPMFSGSANSRKVIIVKPLEGGGIHCAEA